MIAVPKISHYYHKRVLMFQSKEDFEGFFLTWNPE